MCCTTHESGKHFGSSILCQGFPWESSQQSGGGVLWFDCVLKHVLETWSSVPLFREVAHCAKNSAERTLAVGTTSQKSGAS